MLDKTINNALLALRAQIIRENLDGLDHVNALLIQRGIDPAAQHVRRKIPADSCKQREVKMIVLEALRGGAKRPAEIGAHFMACKPGVAPDRAMPRVYRAIYKMRDGGAVVKDGGAWRLSRR
ncbi:hypothetical protein GVY41_17250 [Frigidibacter albus]|uniref:Uncharacterized protein n=1 Tax=Frigidibacter albus TaxID=1465486 RepID=A0A6L8VKM0_9RHOB|nr:hypothetical protein [Frigidibacter albus]MZQ90594.1 hypothetical protein [Frigidibacter albus]NBE32750.1 hypothetical protein [Frigidibacter albus]GGH60723.1 hypothetical protein GCM10011341_33240 [Frigidibacter albus]